MDESSATVFESEADCQDWDQDSSWDGHSRRRPHNCPPPCPPWPWRKECPEHTYLMHPCPQFCLVIPCSPCRPRHCPPPCPPPKKCPPEDCRPERKCCNSCLCCSINLPPHRCVEQVEVDIRGVEFVGGPCDCRLAVDFCVTVCLIDCHGCPQRFSQPCRTIIRNLPRQCRREIPQVRLQGKPCTRVCGCCLKVESRVQICF